MSWKARLVWDNDSIDIDGDFDTEEEADNAALDALGNFRLGNSFSEWNGDDFDSNDPEIEVWDDDE